MRATLKESSTRAFPPLSLPTSHWTMGIAAREKRPLAVSRRHNALLYLLAAPPEYSFAFCFAVPQRAGVPSHLNDAVRA